MYRVSLVDVPSSESEAHLEGALNLWRYKGRAALAVVAIVVGLWIFAHVDAKTDPAPASPAPTHHSHVSGDSNLPPPSFTP